MENIFSVSSFLFKVGFIKINNITFGCGMLTLMLLIIKLFQKNIVIKFILSNIYLTVYGIVSKYLNHNQKYSLVLFSLFLIVSISNLLGAFSFPSLNTFPIFTGILTILIVTLSIIVGIKNKGFRIISDFFPTKVIFPLNFFLFLMEFFSFCLKPIIFCLRLSLNIAIGSLVVHFIEDIIINLGHSGIFLMPLLFLVYTIKVFTAFLQAYLFILFYSIFSNFILENHQH